MSFLSNLMQALLKKKGGKDMFGDHEVFMKMWEYEQDKHRRPFEMNMKNFSVSVERRDIDGMPYFILNGKGKTNSGRMMYLHGGAYLIEITPLHLSFIEKLAKGAGMEVWVPVYPLLPDHTAAEAYGPVMKVYTEMCQTAGDGKVVVAGDSAGAGFALGIAQQARKDSLRKTDQLILLSPWADLTMTNPGIAEKDPYDAQLAVYGLKICGEKWAGGKDIRDPMVSPLFGDMELDSEIVIYTGTRDILNPDAHALYDALKEKSQKVTLVEEEGQPHVYVLWPIPEAKKAQRKICALLK